MAGRSASKRRRQTPATDLNFSPDDMQIVAGAEDGHVWIRQRSTGKIYSGTILVERQGTGPADVRIASLVEIPSANMTQTFANISKLFPAVATQ